MNAPVADLVAPGGKRGSEHGVDLQRGTLKKGRTPSRGGQTEPAVFPSPGRLYFLEVCSLKERKRLFPVTTVRSGYRIDKIGEALV